MTTVNFPSYVTAGETLYVDASASNKLSFLEAITFMDKLKEDGHGKKSFVELPDFQKTFALTNLKVLLLGGRVDLLKASLAYHNIPFDKDVAEGLNAIKSVLKFIEETRFAKVSKDYKLDNDTKGFNVEGKFRIGKKDIAIGYHRSAHHVVERLWKKVAQSWFDTDNGFKGLTEFSQSIGGSHNHVSVLRHMIRVGCKDVKRYELEALALKMGWDFPNELSEEAKNK